MWRSTSVSILLQLSALILTTWPGVHCFMTQSDLSDYPGCVANARIFGGTIGGKGGLKQMDTSLDPLIQLDECIKFCQSFGGAVRCESVSLNNKGKCKAKPHDITMENQELNDNWVTCHRDAYHVPDACKGVECLNEGACLEGQCRCAEGFSGEKCEINNDPCNPNPCQNGGTCTAGVCSCPSGFLGDNCETADPCNPNPCQNGGTCTAGVCSCPSGFLGDNCDTAGTTNCGGHFALSCSECPQGNGADWCNGDCSWIEQCVAISDVDSEVNCGGHMASSCSECPQGNGAEWCNGDCSWVEQCVLDACENVECFNEGACLNGQCQCAEGFAGERCEIDNRDPCDGVVCQNGGTCTDGNCICADGFHGTNCETELDPCDGVNCQNGGTCLEGSCYCVDGFEGDNCETTSPKPVHKWGFIESKSMPGMCVDVDGAPGMKDGANVQLWQCETDIPLITDQLWQITGSGHIISRPSGKCLDLVGMCNKMGLTGIKIHSCETTGNFWGSTDHYWNLQYHNSASEFFRIENRCTGKCADVNGWSVAENGRTIHQWGCEDFGTTGGGGWGKPVRPSDHWWKLVPVDLCAARGECQNGGTCVEGVCNCVDGFEGDNCEREKIVHNWGFIESYSMPGMCMDVDGNPGVRDGANVQLWSCEKSSPQTSDQIWDIMDNGHIVNRPSGKCLDLVGMCNKLGLTGIKINTCEDKGYRNFWGQTDHFWRKRYHDSTYFRIENICTGKCADVSGWSEAENGKTIHQFGCEEWGDFKMKGGGWGRKKEKKPTDHWWKFVPVDL